MTSEFKDILVLLDGVDPAADDMRCAFALELAQNGARLTGVYIGPPDDWRPIEAPAIVATPFMPLGGFPVSETGETAAAAGQPRMSLSEEHFLETTRGAAARWTSAANIERVLHEVRCADLVVAGQTSSTAPSGLIVSIDEIATQGGRPILIVPYIFGSLPASDRHIGMRVLIAWNGSAEASRAAHDALPFLKTAPAVTVLVVDESHSDDRLQAERDAGAFIEHLSQHGVTAKLEIQPSASDVTPADIILNCISDYSCDLLVMGAYSRGRLRESWFGGATRDLFQHMTAPVLTSH